MPNRAFAPVWIRDKGPLGLRSVESLSEAIAFLERWPGEGGGSFQEAIETAGMAVTGHVSVLEAREAFWRFAADAKILAESTIA